MRGRIFFAGNPWPEGHDIREFRWSAERRGDDVWFGFHLETVEYYHERDVEHDESIEYLSDWVAPIVWGNYHHSVISSDAWHQGGFIACPVADYSVGRIDKAGFHVDPLPRDLADDYETRAFHIYLLGHDAVADHHILFARVAGTDLFNITWEGRIALAYAGDYEPKYRFRAEIADVPFPRIADASGSEPHLRLVR